MRSRCEAIAEEVPLVPTRCVTMGTMRMNFHRRAIVATPRFGAYYDFGTANKHAPCSASRIGCSAAS